MTAAEPLTWAQRPQCLFCIGMATVELPLLYAVFCQFLLFFCHFLLFLAPNYEDFTLHLHDSAIVCLPPLLGHQAMSEWIPMETKWIRLKWTWIINFWNTCYSKAFVIKCLVLGLYCHKWQMYPTMYKASNYM